MAYRPPSWPVTAARHHVCMTKVSERAAVPPLDPDRRALLARALDTPGVVAASLIGSQATGTAGPLSDVDVAIWLMPNLDRDRRYELTVNLLNAAAEALGTAEVDLVVLNDASPLMRQRAMQHGVRLVERDRAHRIRLEAKGLLAYLDTVPLRATLDEGVRRRIDEGRFGRR